MAGLFGLGAAPPAACRVLELGAGDGGNLIPMALQLPGSTFVGIDLAAEPVARGAALAAELGAGNLDLRVGDLAALPSDLGEFDYIISHGVYSWIPPGPRDGLLAACSRHLAGHGVAYISYNAYPGSYLRDMSRDILRFHVDGVDDPRGRIDGARALMEAVVAADAGSAYADVLREQFERLLQHPDAALFHDDLAEVNTPVYFHEFMAHAARHGLQFLSEARLRDSQLADLPEAVAEALSSLPDDVIVREQYLDFLVNRMFRQTLLCHADVELTRELGPDALRGTWLAAPLEVAPSDAPGARARVQGVRGAAATPTSPELAAALQAVADAWPAAVAYDDLVAAAPAPRRAALGASLLEAHAAALVDAHRHPPTPACAAGARPSAPALARRQAAAGAPKVTNLRHASVALEDPLAAHLLTLLDGTRDRAALATAVQAFAAAGGLDGTGVAVPAPAALPAALDAALGRLARLSLLTG